MAQQPGKLNRLINAADKITSSKLGQSLGKTLNIVGATVDAAAQVANHQLDEHRKLHRDDLRVPDISGLTLEQAQTLLDDLNLRYALVAITPSRALADGRADTIIQTSPKAKVLVRAGSFVKVLYLDEETLTASRALADDHAARQANRQAAVKSAASKVGRVPVDGVKGVARVTAKLSRKLKPRRKGRRIIKATEEDVIIMPMDDTDNDE